MNNLAKLMIGSVASLGMATAAVAGTFTPTGGSTVSTGGSTIEVRKLLTLNCQLDANIVTTPAAGGSTSVTEITTDKTTTEVFIDFIALAAGDSNCDNVAFTSSNMPVTYVDADTIEIHDIDVIGVTGNCSGSLRADVNQSTGVITFSHSNSIPATSGFGNCSVSGSVPTSLPVSYTTP